MHEADCAGRLADADVGDEEGFGRECFRRAVRAAVAPEPYAVQAPCEREEDACSVRTPDELDDANGKDAQAFSARLFHVRERAFVTQAACVHHAPCVAQIEIVDPEIEALVIVVGRSQPGDSPPVRAEGR